MLDKSLTEFLEQGLAVHIGTRNARMEPNGCRITAVRVENQGRHLVAFVPTAAVGAILPDLRDNGQAAVSFARPADDRAVQVKGEFVDVQDVPNSDETFVMSQWAGFLQQLDMVGIPGTASTSAWTMWPCVAVTIRVTSVFSQTPGPEAGAKLS